jgi:penicillin V acylase-like amidase (Ntn superfamily)
MVSFDCLPEYLYRCSTFGDCVMVSTPHFHLSIPSRMMCSSFLLRQPHTFLIGHNLDAACSVPGVIVCNPRQIHKTNMSFFELVSARKPPAPPFSWTATYGSITFNPMGCEFPDGGINEAGLYVQEITLPGTRFPDDPQRPRLFMAQWIQYLLDTCQSVADILAVLNRVVLDGWEWHFFVADRAGHYAAIDFFEGQPHSYTDRAMPIPVLCNACYRDEIAKLARYAGFGGQQPIQLKDIRFDRFIHAAALLQQAPEGASVADGFHILEQLERGSTQWSQVIDMRAGRVYFRTAQARQIKYLDMHQLDFTRAGPVSVVDINRGGSGDVTSAFQQYSAEENWWLVKQIIETVDAIEGGFTSLVKAQNQTLAGLIQRVAEYPSTIGTL